MELSFILSDAAASAASAATSAGTSEQGEAPAPRQQAGGVGHKAGTSSKSPTASLAAGPQRAGKSLRRRASFEKAAATSDRQQHVRELQNLRQRRYRARKKTSAWALDARVAALREENARLERDILRELAAPESCSRADVAI